ncbi:MAG: phosphatase PAP2 family protein [Magnetococcales bacterium]|nr:phosphatase PAP2 family protein [Magnetococcales bacterium]
MKLSRSFWVALVSLLLVFWISETTEVDFWVQDRFFDFKTGQWLIWKDDETLRLIFYSGAKAVIALFGGGLFFLLLVSWKRGIWIAHRQFFLLVLLSLIVVPSLTAWIKSVSNVHCPWSITRYGGEVPKVAVLAPYPADFKSERPGKCFPAGHPSGGFAFMMLFHAFHSRRARMVGLWFGISLGWVMGIYQMLKGAHYFSHVIITMLLAWVVIEVINWFVNYLNLRYDKK